MAQVSWVSKAGWSGLACHNPPNPFRTQAPQSRHPIKRRRVDRRLAGQTLGVDILRQRDHSHDHDPSASSGNLYGCRWGCRAAATRRLGRGRRPGRAAIARHSRAATGCTGRRHAAGRRAAARAGPRGAALAAVAVPGSGRRGDAVRPGGARPLESLSRRQPSEGRRRPSTGPRLEGSTPDAAPHGGDRRRFGRANGGGKRQSFCTSGRTRRLAGGASSSPGGARRR